MSHRGVLGVFLTGSNLTHYHLAGVGPHPHLEIYALLSAQLVRVAPDLRLHPKCRKQCALRMIFLSDRRSEQGEDTVAGLLGDVTVIVMDGVDHQLQRWIDNGAGFLGVEVLDEFHRSLDVGEQHSDRLALTIRRGIRGFCAYEYRRACSGGVLRFAASTIERLRTFKAELRGWRILCVAGRTSAHKRRRTFHA